MPEYWSPADIAHHYGVTRAAVVQWRHQPTFPAPAFHVQRGQIPVYDRAAVEQWRAQKLERRRRKT